MPGSGSTGGVGATGFEMDAADSAGCVLAMTTVPDEAWARRLAKQLVEGRLAACVNQVRVDSAYRWKGEVEAAPEVLLLIKTTRARQADLQKALLEVHPYELPEFITLPVAGGSEAYLKWLQDSV